MLLGVDSWSRRHFLVSFVFSNRTSRFDALPLDIRHVLVVGLATDLCFVVFCWFCLHICSPFQRVPLLVVIGYGSTRVLLSYKMVDWSARVIVISLRYVLSSFPDALGSVPFRHCSLCFLFCVLRKALVLRRRLMLAPLDSSSRQEFVSA